MSKAVMMANAIKAATSALRATAKSAKTPPAGASAYVLFSKAKREELMKSDAAFQTMKPTEQMSYLGTAWKDCGTAEKEKYEAESKAAKATAKSGAPPEWPQTIKLTSEAAMERLAKQIAEAAIKATLADIAAAAGKDAKSHFVPGFTLSQITADPKNKAGKAVTLRLTARAPPKAKE